MKLADLHYMLLSKTPQAWGIKEKRSLPLGWCRNKKLMVVFNLSTEL
jgi:hypothetical protein